MDKHIDAAITWLSESDIRNRDQAKPSFGGINNGYIYKDKTYQYVYNEITGYAINAFLVIYKWTGDKKYLDYSKNAADYLIRQQNTAANAFESRAIPHSLVLPNLQKINKCYSFDNAIILHGMVNLYKITEDEKYQRCCLDLGNWLTTTQKDNGSFFSHYDAQEKILDHPYDEFFFDHGCLHVKNAIGLIYLGQLTKDRRYEDAGLKICNWSKKLLADDGLFWANQRKKYVFTHAHCYATEGYLFAYHLSRQAIFLDIARKAGEGLIGLQNQDGSLFRIYKNKLSMKRWIGNTYKMSFKRWRSERKHPWKTIDATSQAARIWMLLYSIEKEEKYLNAANQAIAFIKSNQVLSTEDQNMFGGFYYQSCEKIGNGGRKINEGMYAWCTQFGMSALMMGQFAQEGKPFDELIGLLY
jgi:uncharacterized protein YyaL (SSP411 family)